METLTQERRRLLRVPEVARILDISEQRVYEMARQGLLPHVRLGRQIRIDHRALDDFIGQGGQALPGGWRKDV